MCAQMVQMLHVLGVAHHFYYQEKTPIVDVTMFLLMMIQIFLMLVIHIIKHHRKDKCMLHQEI